MSTGIPVSIHVYVTQPNRVQRAVGRCRPNSKPLRVGFALQVAAARRTDAPLRARARGVAGGGGTFVFVSITFTTAVATIREDQSIFYRRKKEMRGHILRGDI